MTLRLWHRRIGLWAVLFLLLSAVTGVWLETEHALEEEENERPSGVLASQAGAEWPGMLAKALQAAAERHPDRPVQRISARLNRPSPSIVLLLGPGKDGGPRRLVVDARTGSLLKDEEGEGESLLLRLHTGEILGDGGAYLGIAWGLALAAMSLTGIALWRKRK